MKRVEVECVDTNIMHGWAGKDEVSTDNLPDTWFMGYVFSEDSEKLILVMGYSNYGLYIERVTIPRGCIKSVKELRVK